MSILSTRQSVANMSLKIPTFTLGKSTILLVNLITLIAPFLADWKCVSPLTLTQLKIPPTKMPTARHTSTTPTGRLTPATTMGTSSLLPLAQQTYILTFPAKQ